MKHEQPYWMTYRGQTPTKVRGQCAAVLALLETFSEDIPKNFLFNGQTWEERADMWVSFAIDQLREELKEFKGETPEDADEIDDKETQSDTQPDGDPSRVDEQPTCDETVAVATWGCVRRVLATVPPGWRLVCRYKYAEHNTPLLFDGTVAEFVSMVGERNDEEEACLRGPFLRRLTQPAESVRIYWPGWASGFVMIEF